MADVFKNSAVSGIIGVDISHKPSVLSLCHARAGISKEDRAQIVFGGDNYISSHGDGVATLIKDDLVPQFF